MSSSRAEDWRSRGGHFSWAPDGAEVEPVEVFRIEAGDPQAPPLLLVHGFPTSSIDWYETIDRFAERFRVCALDFPGYGFSDKPRSWGYSLQRDAELLRLYLAEVVGSESPIVLAHDRGDSVALLLAGDLGDAASAIRPEHLFLTNGNVYLPMSNLTAAQRAILDEATAPDLLENVTPALLAASLGATTFWPPRNDEDPAIQALAETFAHRDGVALMHETIQYLVERSADEGRWLEALAESDLPTTVIWGLNDTVAPPRVASWVWNRKLMLKAGRNSIYFVPDAGHYLQNDRPGALVDTVMHALDADDDQELGAIAAEAGAPILVDRSRSRIPSAAEVLSGE